jgi:hypothetical protein
LDDGLGCQNKYSIPVIASEAKQSSVKKKTWIASSLRSSQ